MKRLQAYLQGGLGNQCFIYATARALALRAGVDVSLDLDYLSEDFVYRRKLALDSFACAFEVAKPHAKWVRVGKLLRYKLLRDRTSRVWNLCIDRRPFKFRPLPTDWCGTLTLDGYWQSEKYFYAVREQLLQDFQLKDTAWLGDDPVARQIQAAAHSVFLHVRSYKEVPGKGDGQCAMSMTEYYRKAVAYVVEHVADPLFFVFSDDIPFARQLLALLISSLSCHPPVFVAPLPAPIPSSTPTPSTYTYPSGQIRDFTLMRMCKHGIVADSSFSWWAGWLGEQERLLKGEKPLRIRVNRRVMNDDFWPERWVAL